MKITSLLENTAAFIMFEIYSEAFGDFNMGMSSALSVVVLILTVGLTVSNLRFLKIKL